MNDIYSNDEHRFIEFDPGDLVAAIPHILGFYPERSLVMVGLARGTPHVIDFTTRVDLPSPAEEQDVISRMMAMVAFQPVTHVVLVVIDADGSADDLPHRDLIAECRERFANADFVVVRQMWTATTATCGLWSCYEHDGCGGVVPDPQFSAVAVASVQAGFVTFRTREELAAVLDPDANEALARRNELLATADPAAQSAHDLLALAEAAVDRALTGSLPAKDHEFVLLAVALSNHEVRDALLDVGAPERGMAAERLWACLVRGIPSPERAEPAALLAFSAYARGDGVLAKMALERAVVADPEHRLAGLLTKVLSLGARHSMIRGAAKKSAALARAHLFSG